MNAPARKFEAKPAVRTQVPVLLGLIGPSGSGKTKSALRIAKGIQSVTGGEIYGIDTEARRMLHYADEFKFEHVQFDAPFGSLDYLAALQQVVQDGAKVVIVDSMSHEHEGPGGLLDLHDKELSRLTNGDLSRAKAFNMLAWQKPKSDRRKLINGILQLNCNFIFCFRAKDTVKPTKVNGRTEIVPQGFMPIAGDEFLFEQTANILLLPKSGGIPTWQSENVGEKLMMKLPNYLAHAFTKDKPLDEETGRALAEWAAGGTPPASSGRAEASERHVAGRGDSEADGLPTAEEYDSRWRSMLVEATDAKQLHTIWTSDEHKSLRRKILWPDDDTFDKLKADVDAKIQALKQ